MDLLVDIGSVEEAVDPVEKEIIAKCTEHELKDKLEGGRELLVIHFGRRPLENDTQHEVSDSEEVKVLLLIEQAGYVQKDLFPNCAFEFEGIGLPGPLETVRLIFFGPLGFVVVQVGVVDLVQHLVKKDVEKTQE